MPPDSASSGDRVWTRRWRARVIDDACRELDRRAEMLERRRECGFVRECHGDLHLRNIGRWRDDRRSSTASSLTTRFPARTFLRSRVSPDGSLAAKTAAPCQHRVEPLPGRDDRFRRRPSPAAVSVLPGGGSRQDERDGSTPLARRATPL
jgi:hypothetical protein